ncbi:hypothetical protein SFB21_2892 [Acinetobacter bouvetii]|uniref:Uncharacterized protein n=2 Tax=Acinetobacter bouvetii TaxID=202951 RepID=A0A811GM06_9GAMM|nr:hypothetical protein SFB21_2888 [Acinetobacter bouvetii]CAB1221609.1 hypothetical protein SFB21_2892 [Acinetobacter bouvetii]
MNMPILTYKDTQDFTQAAFNRVAELVSQHGQCALENFVPAFSTEQCLEHLALVASEMAYDYSFIDAHADIYKKTNAELKEEMGDC